MFRLAHVTDPHFRGFTGMTVADLAGKRALGMVNLLVNRGRKHKMELLEALKNDLRTRNADHVALTGDLSNVSLEAEWKEALRWIADLGTPSESLTVIPGNHDAYVPDVVASGIFERLFGGFQTADLRRADATYPFVRLRDSVAIIAVNTCVATGDLGAWGEIGEAQRARLESLLTAPEVSSRVRVVLLHHPPVMHRLPEGRNLRDRKDLVALLSRTGADLVLHGHDHRDEQVFLDAPNGKRIPVIGAGSASYAGRAERRSRYNIYEIDSGAITAITYAHNETSNKFEEAHRQSFS